MLFVLTYHKALNLTNASRYPVRFLLPEMAELLLGYLIMVIPFRIHLSNRTGVPEEISEYLFSKGKKVNDF